MVWFWTSFAGNPNESTATPSRMEIRNHKLQRRENSPIFCPSIRVENTPIEAQIRAKRFRGSSAKASEVKSVTPLRNQPK
jgi:hypothetical protein